MAAPAASAVEGAAAAAVSAAAAPAHRPSAPQRRILTADYDDEGVWCYQAYKPSIGLEAVKRGRFAGIPGFSPTRMTWIKFSLGWMMYRCDYARARDQETVLRIKISYEALNKILSSAVGSTWNRRLHATKAEWQQAMATGEVRFQWDPERDAAITKLPHNQRALQLGLAKSVAVEYATNPKWILSVEDVTPLVKQIRAALDSNGAIPMPKLFNEREYVIADANLRHSLAMDAAEDDDHAGDGLPAAASSAAASSSTAVAPVADSSSPAIALPPNPALNPPPFIFKIVTAAEWADSYEKTGRYCGSGLDKKDGFIHISHQEHTPRTIELYYANQKDILLVQLRVSSLLGTGRLQWDWVPSRNTYFPHFYDLDRGFQAVDIEAVHRIEYDESAKKHRMPAVLSDAAAAAAAAASASPAASAAAPAAAGGAAGAVAGDPAARPPNPIAHPPAFVYKIVPQADWNATFEARGRYGGSALDEKDGFMHLSDTEHTARTIELYYGGQKAIVLVQVKTAPLLATGQLKWEWAPSRAAYFPHLYDLERGIQRGDIEAVHRVEYDETNNMHVMPAVIRTA